MPDRDREKEERKEGHGAVLAQGAGESINNVERHEGKVLLGEARGSVGAPVLRLQRETETARRQSQARRKVRKGCGPV